MNSLVRMLRFNSEYFNRVGYLVKNRKCFYFGRFKRRKIDTLHVTTQFHHPHDRISIIPTNRCDCLDKGNISDVHYIFRKNNIIKNLRTSRHFEFEIIFLSSFLSNFKFR